MKAEVSAVPDATQGMAASAGNAQRPGRSKKAFFPRTFQKEPDSALAVNFNLWNPVGCFKPSVNSFLQQ